MKCDCYSVCAADRRAEDKNLIVAVHAIDQLASSVSRSMDRRCECVASSMKRLPDTIASAHKQLAAVGLGEFLGAAYEAVGRASLAFPKSLRSLETVDVYATKFYSPHPATGTCYWNELHLSSSRR